MKTSPAGLALIREFEGLRLEAYPDPGTGGEPWTIGVGHTGGVRPGDTCTEEQAMAWLAADVEGAEGCVTDHVPQPLTQGQFDALVSFVFNIGCGAFSESTLLRKLNAGDIDGAAYEFGRWVRAAGKVLPGLVRRREAERVLFTS